MVRDHLVCRMQEADIAGAVDIWVGQYKKYCCSSKSFPRTWIDDTSMIAGFLSKKVHEGAAIVVKSDGRLLGYLAYDEFPFHEEKSVFSPSIAHAAIDEHKEEAYLSLYECISKEWVGRDVFNHMWTIFFNDDKLRSILFDLGFGSYVVDAFACANDVVAGNSFHRIRKAELSDIEILSNLAEESREYYSSAPLFLKRGRYSIDAIAEVISNSNIFIAYEGDNPVGFINVSVSTMDNIIELSSINSGLIDEIGVYVKPEYRGKGLGKALLKCVFDHCRSLGIESIHVDFETANLFANKFWRKHFDPMLLSLRRTVNKDINDQRINVKGR